MKTSSFLIFKRFSILFLIASKSIKRSTTLFPPSKLRLHKSQFWQKLSGQKPVWDEGTLSSLVNKQDALTLFLKIVTKLSKNQIFYLVRTLWLKYSQFIFYNRTF